MKRVCMCKEAAPLYTDIYAGRSRSRADIRHRHVTRRGDDLQMICAPTQSRFATESNYSERPGIQLATIGVLALLLLH